MKRHAVRLICGSVLLALAVSLLCGCMPITGWYYQPHSAKGGTRSFAHCGPSDTLVLWRNKVQILVTTYFISVNKDKVIYIKLRIPESRSVVFAPADFRLETSDGSTIGHDVKVDAIVTTGHGIGARYSAEKISYSTGKIKLRGNAHVRNQYGYSEYTVGIEYSDKLPARFILTLPAINVSAATFPSLPIRFTKEKGIWLVGMQC